MEEYLGYITQQFVSDEEMIDFYNNPTQNIFGLLTNQYVVLYNKDGELTDKFKWDGEKHVKVSYRQLNNEFTGKIKPRNLEQQLAFDMLQDKSSKIKILSGRFGSGKDFIMINTALQLVKSGEYDRIVWVRNNVEVKNSKPIGFLPSDMEAKLLPWAMVIADHCGGQEGLEFLIHQGKVEIQHLGFIRGRDIKNAIIMCSEAENMTKEHVQLLIGRVGEGSALWLNGDCRQTDEKVFEQNSGLTAAIDRLKGNKLFGYVHLAKTERSETAALADLLD